VMCAHRETAYEREPWLCGVGPGICGCLSGTCARLSESEKAQDHTIALPLFHQMTDADQDEVATSLINAVRQQSCVDEESSKGRATG